MFTRKPIRTFLPTHKLLLLIRIYIKLKVEAYFFERSLSSSSKLKLPEVLIPEEPERGKEDIVSWLQLMRKEENMKILIKHSNLN